MQFLHFALILVDFVAEIVSGREPNAVVSTDKVTKEGPANPRKFMIFFATLNALFVSLLSLYYMRSAPFSDLEVTLKVVSICGYLFRIWAMQTLARFFTFSVTIREDHKLVSTGPYSLLIHPSYTGFMFGYVFNVAHLCALLVRMDVLPVSYAYFITLLACVFFATLFITRMRTEEATLKAHFKSHWTKYVSTRWRLVPFIY